MEYSLDHFGAIIDTALTNLEYPSVASRLYEPIRYTLQSGGKRLRPVLTLAVYAALSGRDPQEAVNQAMAVEMFHNFTLLHDDVMDSADLRRGRPTVHRKWNVNTAILSGDAMLTMASQLLQRGAGDRLDALAECFNTTAMEVYQGQQLDIDFESMKKVTPDEYIEMIRLKTSVLLAAACELGAIMAGADEDTRRALYEYGIALGLAFQLRDDWLDTFGDPAVFGKEIGGDIINRKKTWLLITALKERYEDVMGVLEEDLEPQELVRQVRRHYDALKLGDRCQKLAVEYSRKAASIVNALDIDRQAVAFFESLAMKASSRDH